MAFTINGTSVKEPAHGGITITEEPIWASNTGRLQDGTMDGDFVGWKRTFEVVWGPLTFSEADTILHAIESASPFFAITFTNTRNGRVISGSELTMTATTETATVYCSNIPRTVYSLTSPIARHVGVTITFIEK